jgi:phage shock protein A
MWERLKRLFRSLFGSLISGAEDPKLILEQNIRDMRDKVPEINTGIAKARGGIVRLDDEASTLKQEIARLTSQTKAALRAGEEGLAGQCAVQIKRKQEALERNQSETARARQGYDGLLKLKEHYMREMKLKTEQAMAAIKQAEAAKWKNELADVFQSFEVAGVDATHQEMIEKLKERSAMAEGKIASAVESMDITSIELEEKAQALEGQDLLRQFKLEMGLDKAAPAATAAPSEEQQKALEEFKKTIGPEKTKVQ